MSQFDDAFDDVYKAMYKKLNEPYEKYLLHVSEGKGVSKLLSERCTIEELNNLQNQISVVLGKKGSIKTTDLPEEIRLLRYSYHNLNGPNTGNIHTKRDYKRMADDIQHAIKLLTEETVY